MGDYRCKHDALLAAGLCIQCIEEENESLTARVEELEKDRIDLSEEIGGKIDSPTDYLIMIVREIRRERELALTNFRFQKELHDDLKELLDIYARSDLAAKGGDDG